MEETTQRRGDHLEVRIQTFIQIILTGLVMWVGATLLQIKETNIKLEVQMAALTKAVDETKMAQSSLQSQIAAHDLKLQALEVRVSANERRYDKPEKYRQ